MKQKEVGAPAIKRREGIYLYLAITHLLLFHGLNEINLLPCSVCCLPVCFHGNWLFFQGRQLARCIYLINELIVLTASWNLTRLHKIYLE